MNYNLTPGISLDDRNLITNIPDDTEIKEFKYIAKVDENNYIAEDFIEVDGYDGKCSIGYIRYLENNEPHQGIFYLKSNSNVQINVENIIFPKKFGVITEINEDAVLYSNITRKSNEKVYVIGEDLSKKESLDKNTIQTNIEESVRSYGVPNNSVIGFDGNENDIPNGYELTNESFGGGGTEVFICGENQTIDDAPEEAKIIIDSNIANSKAVNITNFMAGNETDIAPSVNAVKNYVDGKGTYSTNEVVVGTWINGKPIYRRVIDMGELPSNTSKIINHNIENIDFVTSVKGLGITSTNHYNIPFAPIDLMYSGLSIGIRASDTEISLATNKEISGHRVYGILEYTKTTDKEVSE